MVYCLSVVSLPFAAYRIDNFFLSRTFESSVDVCPICVKISPAGGGNFHESHRVGPPIEKIIDQWGS